MLNIKIGNLLDVKSGIIVHGCNMQGVMGSGVALAVKQKYPDAFHDYKRDVVKFSLGDVIYSQINKDLIVANALTQQDFGKDGKRYVSYAAVSAAFESICQVAHHTGLTVHFPLIGAGLGGGDWAIISNIIELKIARFEVAHTLWIVD